MSAARLIDLALADGFRVALHGLDNALIYGPTDNAQISDALPRMPCTLAVLDQSGSRLATFYIEERTGEVRAMDNSGNGLSRKYMEAVK